jgi:uncharacterized Zn ribbon protein
MTNQEQPLVISPQVPMRFPYPLALALLLLSLPACTSDKDEAETSSTDTTTIPFDKEGRLAVIQDGDTLVVLDL